MSGLMTDIGMKETSSSFQDPRPSWCGGLSRSAASSTCGEDSTPPWMGGACSAGVSGSLASSASSAVSSSSSILLESGVASSSSRPRASRGSRFASLQAVPDRPLEDVHGLVVIVSALEMTGITVVLPCRVRRTWRSRSSSRLPRTRAAGKFLLPFAWPLEVALLVAAMFRSRRAGSRTRNSGVDVRILHAGRSRHLHLLGEGLLELALQELPTSRGAAGSTTFFSSPSESHSVRPMRSPSISVSR